MIGCSRAPAIDDNGQLAPPRCPGSATRCRATTLKLGVSPIVHGGAVFARFDLGFDSNFDADPARAGNAIHDNAGVGLDERETLDFAVTAGVDVKR